MYTHIVQLVPVPIKKTNKKKPIVPVCVLLEFGHGCSVLKQFIPTHSMSWEKPASCMVVTCLRGWLVDDWDEFICIFVT